jgi:hypothetical protein
MPLITFIPSVRKILFFQKKIKQLHVEFIAAMVEDQNSARMALFDVDTVSLEVMLSPI